MAVADRILQDCFKLIPELAGPEIIVEGNTKRARTWKDIEIVSHNVGLRPARKGGVRVELEERQLPGIVSEKRNDKVAVVHAYGIGPAGFQASLGIAEEATRLADEWLRVRESEARDKVGNKL